MGEQEELFDEETIAEFDPVPPLNSSMWVVFSAPVLDALCEHPMDAEEIIDMFSDPRMSLLSPRIPGVDTIDFVVNALAWLLINERADYDVSIDKWVAK
jgi:hypothetical protein